MVILALRLKFSEVLKSGVFIHVGFSNEYSLPDPLLGATGGWARPLWAASGGFGSGEVVDAVEVLLGGGEAGTVNRK